MVIKDLESKFDEKDKEFEADLPIKKINVNHAEFFQYYFLFEIKNFYTNNGILKLFKNKIIKPYINLRVNLNV